MEECIKACTLESIITYIEQRYTRRTCYINYIFKSTHNNNTHTFHIQ